MALIDGFLAQLGDATRITWADAIPAVMLDTWWARGDADRVLGVLATASQYGLGLRLAELAVLDRDVDRDRAARTARAAVAAASYPSVPATVLVAAIVDDSVELAARRALRHEDAARAVLRLIRSDPPDPDDVPADPLLRAWHAVRVDPAGARAALAAAWDAVPQDETTAVLFATRAAGAWDAVPARARPLAARLLGFERRLDMIEELAAAATGDERGDIYCAAAITAPTLPASWIEPIRACAALADEHYGEGLIMTEERDVRVWAAARCDGAAAVRALEIAALAGAHAAAKTFTRELEAPPAPVSRRMTQRLDKALAAACADPTSRLWPVGRELERIGEHGGHDIVRAAIDQLEAVRGPLGDDLEDAQLHYPGRALALAEQLTLWTVHRRCALVAALVRDGHVAEARHHAAALFDEAVPPYELPRIATFVLDSQPDARDRCSVYACQILDLLPGPEPAAAERWLDARYAGAVPQGPPATVARSAELEGSLAEDDDPETAAVYADFLSTHGDPRGELIALQRAGRRADAELLIARHRDHFFGPLGAFARTHDGTALPAFTWAHGFLATARLGCYPDRAPEAEGVSLESALDALLTHPSAALLRELTVTINVTDRGCDFSPVPEVIARRGAPALRALRIGEFSFPGSRSRPRIDIDYEISWARIPDLSAIWSHVPRLEQLTLQGSLEAAVLDGIALPRLRSLVIMTGGMARENIAAIARAAWPALDTLELWFGDARYGATCTAADVAPLLDRERFPRLSTLRLLDAGFADELVAPLVASSLLPQLDELGLALGTLSDQGAAQLAAHRERFAHLAVLDLDRSCLTDDGIELVAEIADEVRCDEQKDERYVSVGE